MAAVNWFNKLADEMEDIASRFEEGFGILMNGGGADASGDGSDSTNDFEIKDEMPADLESLSQEEIQKLIQEEMMMNSPLNGIADNVLSDIMSRQALPSSPLEHFHAFRSAITWTEPFVLSLLAFQFTMFFLCLWASRKDRALAWRVSVMLFIAIVVRSAEWLNAKGAEHWKSFSQQDYFDKGGVFVGIMLCAPLLLDSLMMLCMFLAEAAQLLVQVKREEIKRKDEAKTQKESTTTKTSTAKRGKTKKQD